MMSDDSSSEGINTGPLDHWVYTTKKTKAVGLQFWLFMSLNDLRDLILLEKLR